MWRSPGEFADVCGAAHIPDPFTSSVTNIECANNAGGGIIICVRCDRPTDENAIADNGWWRWRKISARLNRSHALDQGYETVFAEIAAELSRMGIQRIKPRVGGDADNPLGAGPVSALARLICNAAAHK